MTIPLLKTPISLARLDILDLAVPQVESFRSAIGTRHERRALYVRWEDQDGAWGIGESSCRPDPYFNAEFVDGATLVLRDHLTPLLPRESTLGELEGLLSRVRGWPFTRAAVLDAACDLVRRRGGKDPLDAWPGKPLRKIPVGISLGLYDRADEAVERVEQAVERGYRRVKMKVKPGMSLGPLHAVRDAFPMLALGFDANGSGGPGDASFFRSLAELDPVMLEQPFPAGRFDLCRELRGLEPALRICLDESITCLGMLRAARELGALDEVNIKPGRVGGQFETLRLLAECREHKTPAWIGGMFETGIGRLACLRFAAHLPDARAHDLSPSNRYFLEDVVREPFTMDEEGQIEIGRGRPVELDEAAIERMCVVRGVLFGG